jgi:hypothetical protein
VTSKKPPPQKTEAGRALHGLLTANIRAELERQGLHQTDLGKLLTGDEDETGAGVRRVRRLLAGADPDFDSLAEFAAALAMEPFELIRSGGPRRRKRAKPHESSE